MPSQVGSGYLPEPGGSSLPCRLCRCSTYARAPFNPVSSLFHSANRIERSVVTSGAEKTRASSMTSAVPEPSSFAASPQPMPSMGSPAVAAALAARLLFDAVDGGAVACRALPAIAELGEAFKRRFVMVEIETRNELRDGIGVGSGGTRAVLSRGRHARRGEQDGGDDNGLEHRSVNVTPASHHLNPSSSLYRYFVWLSSLIL